MKCKGNFKFKELKKLDAGSFTDKETGEVISYNESYKLKVDEITEQGINERIFKVAIDNVNVLNALKTVKAYDNIDIEFDLEIYSNGCRLIPLAVIPLK